MRFFDVLVVGAGHAGCEAALAAARSGCGTKGAFTGATTDKTGLLEEADGGSLLLDEIAEMPVELQAKLLRVLEERVVRRLGGAKPGA